MAVARKTFKPRQQIFGVSDAFASLNGTTLVYSSGVNLAASGFEGAHVTVEINHGGTTDYAEIYIYGALTATAFDNTPLSGTRSENSETAQQLSFVIKDLALFRVGIQQDGATDVHTARVYYRPWLWDTGA